MASYSEGEGDEDIAVKFEPLEAFQDIKPEGLSNKRNFGTHSFSESEQRSIRQKLDVGLSRNETMQRPGPGGSRLTYIEGWKVIHDANQIFGFNGWSSHIVSLDLRYVDERAGRFSACVSATVRITLRDGAYREDRGGGTADNMRSKGDAILKAEKEAVTDATKRSLKNFGLRLGLSLYDRQHVRDMNKPAQPARPTHAVNTPTGMHTPQSRRPTTSHPQPMASTTPNSVSKDRMPSTSNAATSNASSPPENAKDVKGRQFAAQREKAIARKQAFLKALASEEKAKLQRSTGPPSALRAQNGVSMASFPINNNTTGTHAGYTVNNAAAIQTGNSFSPVSPGVEPNTAGWQAHDGGGMPRSNDHGKGRAVGRGSNAGQAAVQRPISGGGGEMGKVHGMVNGGGGQRGGSGKTDGVRGDDSRRQREIEEATRLAFDAGF
eukprot:GFKZ01013212.1.p1 GENE.GFKZ01013212.1~~GFKZ01013212.1.p1  ORF type:complete len:493 (+),score=49.24 GFKZ01013212.1:169-1479(+)